MALTLSELKAQVAAKVKAAQERAARRPARPVTEAKGKTWAEPDMMVNGKGRVVPGILVHLKNNGRVRLQTSTHLEILGISEQIVEIAQLQAELASQGPVEVETMQGS